MCPNDWQKWESREKRKEHDEFVSISTLPNDCEKACCREIAVHVSKVHTLELASHFVKSRCFGHLCIRFKICGRESYLYDKYLMKGFRFWKFHIQKGTTGKFTPE